MHALVQDNPEAPVPGRPAAAAVQRTPVVGAGWRGMTHSDAAD